MNITGMVTGILPYISYFVNFLTRLLEIFSSYVGIDIKLPTEGQPSNGTESDATPDGE